MRIQGLQSLIYKIRKTQSSFSGLLLVLWLQFLFPFLGSFWNKWLPDGCWLVWTKPNGFFDGSLTGLPPSPKPPNPPNSKWYSQISLYAVRGLLSEIKVILISHSNSPHLPQKNTYKCKVVFLHGSLIKISNKESRSEFFFSSLLNTLKKLWGLSPKRPHNFFDTLRSGVKKIRLQPKC